MDFSNTLQRRNAGFPFEIIYAFSIKKRRFNIVYKSLVLHLWEEKLVAAAAEEAQSHFIFMCFDKGKERKRKYQRCQQDSTVNIKKRFVEKKAAAIKTKN